MRAVTSSTRCQEPSRCATSFRDSNGGLPLSRAHLRLLHRNLVDVRQRPCPGRALNRVDRDVLHLLLRLVKLFLECDNLRRLASDALLTLRRPEARAILIGGNLDLALHHAVPDQPVSHCIAGCRQESATSGPRPKWKYERVNWVVLGSRPPRQGSGGELSARGET